MTPEWKPGDVAIGTVSGRPNVRVIAGWSKYDPQLRWGELSPRWADGDDDTCWWFPSQVTELRPLVVIDFENDAEVRRLLAAIDANHHEKRSFLGPVIDRMTNMRAALREFANPAPPKPDEPQGLGAVVEDATGLTWVRRHPAGEAWVNGYQRWSPWSDIAAVRVLSEGVKAGESA